MTTSALESFARLAALIGVLSAAVIYGTDVFCAVVQRPALARVDDRTLVAVMGNVHRYGDRRMPVPGALSLIASVSCAVLAGLARHWIAAGAAACAVGLLLVWLGVYVRVSAPINRRLTGAATTGAVPTDARLLQAGWDRVISARATLQGVAILALCAALAS